jgi:hypothetical protein
MSRTGQDEFDAQGVLKNGFDYELQCWVKDYRVQNCGHPEQMTCGCSGREYAGQNIAKLRLAKGLPGKDPRGPVDFLTFVRDDRGPLSKPGK